MLRLRQPPGLHPLPDGAPLPCGAAALAALTGMAPDRCVRILEDRHGYFPLASVAIPPTLDALAALGWLYHATAHPDLPAFRHWAAGADPGLYLVSLPEHVIAADVRSTPPLPHDDPRVRGLSRPDRAAYNRWLVGDLAATCEPAAFRSHRAALLAALDVDVARRPPNTVLVADNGHLCSRRPEPPSDALAEIPVDHSARVVPAHDEARYRPPPSPATRVRR